MLLANKFDGHANPILFANLVNSSFQAQDVSYQAALMFWAQGQLFTGTALDHNKIRIKKAEYSHLYQFPPSLTSEQARDLLQEHYNLLCKVYEE